MAKQFKINAITGVTFKAIPCEEHIETCRKWQQVTEEEYLDFVKKYPNKLESDFYMDWYSWNDFSDGKKWPESVVAVESHMYDIDIYKIWQGEYEEIIVPAREESHDGGK